MADYSATYLNRDFSPRIMPVGLRQEVGQPEWADPGGPKSVRITIRGSERAVWGLLDMLRCPVELSLRGTPRWWGYIHGISLISKNGFRLTASLERMANRNKVIYTETVPGNEYTGEQQETSWIEDVNSSGEYGDKEAILNLADGNAEQAAAYGARALAERYLPLPERDFGGMSGKATDSQVELDCRGWWDTLEWQYYSQDAGKESYEDIGTGLQAFGDAAATTKVCQSFQLGSSLPWSVNSIKLRMKKEGTPTDNVTVKICANSSGAPGTALATVTLAGTTVPENLNWLEFTLSTRLTLSLSTTYWITVERSGALDAANYYKIDANEALGYTRGSFKIWNGSAWGARSPDADMLFQLLGVTETTKQIQDIVTASGQFFSGTFIEDASGVFSSPWRDGYSTALECIMALLESGTSNDRRLCATVTRDRTLWLREADAPGAADYTIDGKGVIRDATGSLVEKEAPPVGVWLRMVGVIPATANIGIMADPTRVFVTGAIWDQKAKITRWSFMGMRYV